jgi:ubiquitin fusion degradation protein 1
MFFNHPFFRQNFPGVHGVGGAAAGPFRADYQCYSAAFLPERDRDRLNVENGGKILLPQAALEQLIDQQGPEQQGVMLFKLKNKKLDRIIHCGVLEFLPNDHTICYLPNWMMRHLLLQEGDDISVESVSLPTATFVRFQPQSKDFLDISSPKAVLEKALRNFNCLTKGDLIAINYLNRSYELCVLELKPADAVSIIECDMEVDFAPPIDYVEPKYTPTSAQNIATTPKTSNPMAMTPGDPLSSIPNSYKSPSTFMPFHGHGNRLNGKNKSKDQEQQQQQNNLQIQQTRGIPNYDYEYGTIQFLRAPLRSINDETVGTTEKTNSNTFQPFSGEGQILKQSKNQRPK